MKSLLALVSFIALAVGSAQASSDLSPFGGKYNGTTKLTYLNQTYTGPASLGFKVKSSGKAGTLSIAASVIAGGNSFDAGNSFRFSPNMAVHIAKLAPAIQTTPLSGTYSSTSRTITASAVYLNAGVTLTCKVKQTGHKVTLTVVETITSSGSVVYQITYIGTRHVK
jgi:hypothetical protein